MRLPVDNSGNILGPRDDDGWGDGFGGDADDEDMMNLLEAGMPKETAKQYLHIYELFLIHGVSRGVAKAKVAELYSPPRVTEEMRRIPNLGLMEGATYDIFQGKDFREKMEGPSTFDERQIVPW